MEQRGRTKDDPIIISDEAVSNAAQRQTSSAATNVFAMETRSQRNRNEHQARIADEPRYAPLSKNSASPSPSPDKSLRSVTAPPRKTRSIEKPSVSADESHDILPPNPQVDPDKLRIMKNAIRKVCRNSGGGPTGAAIVPQEIGGSTARNNSASQPTSSPNVVPAAARNISASQPTSSPSVVPAAAAPAAGVTPAVRAKAQTARKHTARMQCTPPSAEDSRRQLPPPATPQRSSEGHRAPIKAFSSSNLPPINTAAPLQPSALGLPPPLRASASTAPLQPSAPNLPPPPRATSSAAAPPPSGEEEEEEGSSQQETFDFIAKAVGGARPIKRDPPQYRAGVVEIITPSLFVLEESQIAAIPRPSGLEYLAYIMGSIRACHFRNYPSSQISITAGLFIGENRLTRSLVWRETSDAENPRPIMLPSSREDEVRSTNEALEGARQFTDMPGYADLRTLIGNLASMNAAPIGSVNPEELNISCGIYVGQNWDGVVLYRQVHKDERPSPNFGKFRLDIRDYYPDD